MSTSTGIPRWLFVVVACVVGALAVARVVYHLWVQ